MNTTFEANLDNSRLAISKGQEGNYWLNCDGTFCEKTWWGRVVRWIQNLLFNTTLVDIYSVFYRTVSDYTSLRNLYTQHLGNVTMMQVKAQGRRVEFACAFLASRLHRLESNQDLVRIVIFYLNHLAPSPTEQPLGVRLTTLSLEEQDDPAIAQLAFEDSSLTPLSADILAATPPPMELPSLLDSDRDIFDLMKVHQHVRKEISPQLIGAWQWFCSLFSSNSQEKEESQTLKRWLRRIHNQDPNVAAIQQSAKPAFYARIRLLIQHSLPFLENPTIPAAKKYAALVSLMEGSTECGVRWYEDVESLYRCLTNTELQVPDFVLHRKQLFIEQVILVECQDSHHTPNRLNYIRAHWGKALGIDVRGADLDVCREPPPFSLDYLLQRLRIRWPHFVADMRDWINGEPYNPKFAIFLRESLETRGIVDAEVYVQEKYYDADGKITDRGVCHLLNTAFSFSSSASMRLSSTREKSTSGDFNGPDTAVAS